MTVNTYSDKEIFARVKEIIEDILAMESDSEISPSSSMIDDLGMESIDFLDLAIRLEETFNVSVPRRDPLQRAIAAFGREKFIQEGKLTQTGARLLKLVLPEIDQSRIYEGVLESDIPPLITAQTYVNVIKRGLEIADWRPEECEKCGSKDFTPADKDKLEFPDGNVPPGPIFLCNSCGNMITAPSFDGEFYKQLSEEGITLE